MPDQVSLLSLPNELLITIFENPKFPVDYLCTLAVLCRRLHFLALPIYFARNGMLEPFKSAFIPLATDGQDMLAALNMALFISSMEEITCVLPHPSCTSIFPLLPHLRRLRKFISRISSVKRVTLQLDARNSMCNAAGDDEALRAWSSTLGGLLNVVIEKGCTELTVRYGGYLTRSFMLSAGPPTRIRRLVKSVRHVLGSRAALSGKSWEFRRVPAQGKKGGLAVVPGSKQLRSRELSTLHIESACAYHATVICRVSLEKELWNAALTLIAKGAPHLTDLSLCELDSISSVEILKFCSRLRRLTSLKIGNNEEAQGLPTRCTKGQTPAFRHLTSLIAPADFILYFLRPHRCFPRLKSLSITFQGKTKTHIRTVGAQLMAVCQSLASRKLSPSLCLSLPLFSDTITFDFDAVLSLPAKVTRYFEYVASLDLHVFPYGTAEIARWVHLFPSVQHVSLVVRSKPADADADTVRFLHALSQEKSILRTVTINGTKHVLDDLPPSCDDDEILLATYRIFLIFISDIYYVLHMDGIYSSQCLAAYKLPIRGEEIGDELHLF
ncbi:hypothetical protein B0H16DRAFT_1802244 [Mycena metata]|uniref:F-box domain-containing protein n=1 Tax=Mycena metata TaxID=1033252 RepID=A0AAD7NZX9_9AGAR|nr:hypothetical protein B0H16DRAFT_1802244 [Mycena metata]